MRPPPAGAPGLFATWDATSSSVLIVELHVDFDRPEDAFVVETPGNPVPVAPFDGNLSTDQTDRGSVPQPSDISPCTSSTGLPKALASSGVRPKSS